MNYPTIWLYEDNAGGLYIGKDGGPWYQTDGKVNMFALDAARFADTDDMDLEYSLTDGKVDAEPDADLIAKLEDGEVTVLYTSLVGSKAPGTAAKRYLGIE